MKKTIKKRAFVSAIAMLIVSAIVLTSSTFAWFSMSKQATVEEMNLTVSSPEGIQISANAKGWTASLTQDQLFNTDSTKQNATLDAPEENHNYLTTALVPVSSSFGSGDTNGYANFYKLTLNDEGGIKEFGKVNQLTTNDPQYKDPGFVAFDMYLKVAENNTKVYFAKSSEFSDSIEGGQGPITALRVGFQILGTVSPDATPAQAQGLNTFSKPNNYVYEPESFKRSSDAIDAGQVDKNLRTNYIDAPISGLTVNNDKVFGKRLEIVEETLLTDNQYTEVKYYKSVTDATFTYGKNQAYFNLNAGITKVRVYIWLEGQDVDCRNSVASSSITANLKFDID